MTKPTNKFGSEDAFDVMNRCMPGQEAIRIKHPLEDQFELVERLVQPDGNVRQACQEFTKLMKMFYQYLEDKNDS